jgi:hypothetical protein
MLCIALLLTVPNILVSTWQGESDLCAPEFLGKKIVLPYSRREEQSMKKCILSSNYLTDQRITNQKNLTEHKVKINPYFSFNLNYQKTLIKAINPLCSNNKSWLVATMQELPQDCELDQFQVIL